MFGRISGKAKAVIAFGSAATAAGYLGYSGNEWFYRQVVMTCVRQVDPETAHVMAVKCASMGLLPKGKDASADKAVLVRVFTVYLIAIIEKFCNCIALRTSSRLRGIRKFNLDLLNKLTT